MLGNQCNMKEIIKIAKNKIKILEDSCEALGAKLGKKFVGTMGDAGILVLILQKQLQLEKAD